MTVCKICNNSSGNKSYVVREMMFGFRDEFDYFECGKCGCLQIKQVPNDFSKYYPENYWQKVNSKSSIFTEERIQFFRKRAQELNENKEGDQVCIYLYKA